jgi:two-component system, cell cycle sensor histidine kinase and response regulator CckA
MPNTLIKKLGKLKPLHILFIAVFLSEIFTAVLNSINSILFVILDMIMPEMSGKETLIKLMELDKNVRVLLSSGYSIDGEAKTILDLGCTGFIQKPFRIEELSQKIREVLDSRAS